MFEYVAVALVAVTSSWLLLRQYHHESKAEKRLRSLKPLSQGRKPR